MFSQSFLQMNTIFISLLIEAVPFVVVGVFISALIELFITEEMIAKVIPKNRFLSVTMGTCVGSLFPGCECGIVPITQRLVKKRVPLHAAIAFMLTGPIINPIVIFSTYVAFGNSWKMVFYRCGLAMVVSFVVGLIISYIFRDDQLREFINKKAKKHKHHHDHAHDHHHSHSNLSVLGKIKAVIDHAIDEFFSVGKFLVIGSLIASAMQTFIKTSTLVSMGNTKATAILVMILLAFILSVCSEADAFIASSFRNTFPLGPLSAFLVFGAMVDMKNLIMMLSVFKKKFVLTLVLLIFVCVFTGALFI
ncbi:permease [Scopulibacillus cellulosilyticus]|uniref:Permease n=1 Tax=Scopulibacillus cellulosilyticus TaxID=2665665 RepID=A0ABW2Q127_9BACL